jgi:hypothetical protein
LPLSDQERSIIASAGTSAQQTVRGQAVAIVLAKSGADRDAARALLAESYLATTQPSFHLIPRGEAMASEAAFDVAYDVLAQETQGFTSVTQATLTAALVRDPRALAPLRMIIGFTPKELAVATRLIDPSSNVTENTLKTIERRAAPTTAAALQRRDANFALIVAAVLAVMARSILTVPPASADAFHSKLDKRDTRHGWASVATDSGGVPYSALLYQRYVGGVWRQVQDAYSEGKGDALLEVPLMEMFQRERVPFYRSQRGASGATATATQFGINPGPDFLLPDLSPTVIVESKIGEDGGTVRDKAARLKNLATAGAARGLVVCAVIDGKGWSERANALTDVIIATGGRTYTLGTLDYMLDVPEVAALRGTAPP